MTRILKVQLKDLETFFHSELFGKFNHKPISKNRVDSYLNNPKGDPEDIVLYLMLDGEEILAFRTLLSDRLILEEKSQKFAWLSGSFTAPEHRRKGYSMILLDEAYKDWDGNLMSTNFATTSYDLFQRSDYFEDLTRLNGTRFYRRFCLKTILYPKGGIFRKWNRVIGWIDALGNLVFDLRFKVSNTVSKLDYQPLTSLDVSAQEFLKKYKSKELYKRDEQSYQWILDYPWIKPDEYSRKESLNYNFTCYAKTFDSKFYQIRNPLTKVMDGLVMITIREQHLTIPYFYVEKEAMEQVITLIDHLCQKHRINYITFFDEDLIRAFKTNRSSFLYRKSFRQLFVISKTLRTKLPNISTYDIQFGDGDQVFV